MNDITNRPFPATVIKKLNEYELVINRGFADDVEIGEEYLVYHVEPNELIDPETKESLGHLEVVRGIGVVTHVQAKMATIKSNRYDNNPSKKTIRKTQDNMARKVGIESALSRISYNKPVITEVIEAPNKTLQPFDSARVMDKAKKYY